MINFKATLYYKNGELVNKDYPSSEGLNAIEAISMASILTGMELAVGRPASVHKINGNIIVESLDSKIYITYDVNPPDSIEPIEQSIAQMYTVQKKS